MPLHSIQYAAFPFGPRNGFGSTEAHEVTSTRDSKAKLRMPSPLRPRFGDARRASLRLRLTFSPGRTRLAFASMGIQGPRPDGEYGPPRLAHPPLLFAGAVHHPATSCENEAGSKRS